jgi:hypothetical protein
MSLFHVTMPRPEFVTMSRSARRLRWPAGHFKFDSNYTQWKTVFFRTGGRPARSFCFFLVMHVTAARDARYCGLTSPPYCPSNLSFDTFEFLDAFDFLDTFDFLWDLFF